MAVRFRRIGVRRPGGPSLGGNAHAYWETLASSPSVYYSRSLRSQAQLSSLATSTAYNYVFGSDPFEDPQDAAKLIWQSSNATAGQIHSSVTASSEGDFFVTWDVWYSSQWKLQPYGGNVATSNASTTFAYQPYRHKAFQIDMSTGAIGNDGIFFETNLNVTMSTTSGTPGGDTSVGMNYYRVYDNSSAVSGRYTGDAAPIPDGISQSSPSTGLSNKFFVRANVWTRHFQRIRLNVYSSNSTEFASWSTATGAVLTTGVAYHSWSAWVADETQEPVVQFINVPIERRKNAAGQPWTHVRKWRCEMDTSQNHHQSTGQLTIIGNEGVVIPSTQLFLRQPDGGVFRASSGVVITGGQAVVNIEASPNPASSLVRVLGPEGDTSTGVIMLVRPGSSIEGQVDSSAVVTSACINGNYILNDDSVVYVRNLAILRNYGDPTPLLVKPVP